MEEDYEREEYSDHSKDESDTYSNQDSDDSHSSSSLESAREESQVTPSKDPPSTHELIQQKEERSQLTSQEQSQSFSSQDSTSSLRLDNKSSELKDIDRELEELLKTQHSKVKVIGVGGAGGNTISRMKEIGIKGGEIIAIKFSAFYLLHQSNIKSLARECAR